MTNNQKLICTTIGFVISTMIVNSLFKKREEESNKELKDLIDKTTRSLTDPIHKEYEQKLQSEVDELRIKEQKRHEDVMKDLKEQFEAQTKEFEANKKRIEELQEETNELIKELESIDMVNDTDNYNKIMDEIFKINKQLIKKS